MVDFWEAVGAYPLARNALVMALLGSLACGVVGSFVVARRDTYIAAGVAHCVLGGLGAARYLEVVHDWTFLTPLHGAMVAAIGSALVIGLITLYAKEREDTAIGAVWAVGMAAGILFIYKTPGFNQDITGYLFGNILLVSRGDLWLVLALDVLILALVWTFFAELRAVCFDEEFAKLRGLPVQVYTFAFLILTALTVVVLVSVVGIVLVIALLTLPSAIAGRFASSLGGMMALACAVSAALCTAGLWLSYTPDLPAGPTIIVLAGLAYAASLTGSRLLRM